MIMFDEDTKHIISDLNLEKIKERARNLYATGNLLQAKVLYGVLANIDTQDITSRAVYAELICDGQAKNFLRSRDMFLAIFNDFPQILGDKSEQALALFKCAADRCRYVGPIKKCIELNKLICNITNSADDYYKLSDALHEDGQTEESVFYLRKAIEVNPDKYRTLDNLETIELAQKYSSSENSKFRKKNKHLSRYPTQNDFQGDLADLILNHIAVDLKNSNKFLDKNSKIFTMGSCFARNIASALQYSGYLAQNLEITEQLNTSYANIAFIDWLEGKQGANHERIEQLIKSSNPNANRENILNAIKNADIFILTLGVALAFFDRLTGEFILPPPTSISQTSMLNKYIYRETTIEENLENITRVIRFIKNLSPKIKIILTVSPVPLLVSLGHKSCVQADCVSKSTMRLVANEIVKNSTDEDNIIYWPSFESIRWAGSNASNFFGADDNLSVHVSESKINKIIQAFIDTFKR